MIERGLVGKLAVRLPMGVLLPLIMIVTIGIVNLSSAAQATRPDLYLSQLSKFGFAFVIMMAAGSVHTRIIRRFAPLAYIIAVVLLMLVMVVGTSAKGGQRWLVFGAFRLQPSDPAKIAVVLAMARYCSMYWPHKGYSLYTLLRPLNLSRPLSFLALMVFMLVRDRHESTIFSSQLLKSSLGMGIMIALLVGGLIWVLLAIIVLIREEFQLPSIIAPIDVPLLPFFLIYIEPDLGTGVIVLAIAGMMFLFIGIKRSSLLLGTVAATVLAVGAYFTVLKDYQRQRVISFLNPEADLQGDGYQAMQSIIAIGSGRILGKGFNGGTQTQLSFLPENSTDYIFSVWAEEWGFIACIFLLSLYIALLWAILKVAMRVDDQFSQLVCVGVAANIFVHVFINVGMVTGLMPVVGVPLILMSHGGSAMLTTLVGIGLVVNVALWRGAH